MPEGGPLTGGGARPRELAAIHLGYAARNVELRDKLHKLRAHLHQLRVSIEASSSASVSPAQRLAEEELKDAAGAFYVAQEQRHAEAVAAEEQLQVSRAERSQLRERVERTCDALRDDVLSLAATVDGVAKEQQRGNEARDATAALATWLRLEETSCNAQRRIDAASAQYQAATGGRLASGGTHNAPRPQLGVPL